MEGHKPHRDNCFSEKIVCNLCSTSGYTDWHSLLRPCSQCLRENKVCTRLLPLVRSPDCDPKQKTWILCLQIEKSTLTESLFPTAPQHQVSAFRWILALDRHWRLSRKRKATLVIAQRRWGHIEMRFTEITSNFRPHWCRVGTGDPPKRGQEFHSRRESEPYISAWNRIQALEEEWSIFF